MVISDETKIELEVNSREKDYLISLDSRFTTVPKNTKVFIEKTNFTIKSILPKNQSFLKDFKKQIIMG